MEVGANVLRSSYDLFSQLYSQDTNIRPKIREVFEEKRSASAPNEQELQWQPQELKNLFIETVLLSARSRKIVIFIDALDEAGQGGTGAFFHVDQHGQPGVDVQRSRTMEGGRRAAGASNGDEQEGAGAGASFHADQHVQPSVDVQRSRTMEGGRRAGGASNGDEKEGAGAERKTSMSSGKE